jgi:N-formylglutamate amidohydrolase
MRRLLRSSVLAAALAGACGPAGAQAPADLVLVQRGTLPILITAPHGGQKAIPSAGLRNVMEPGLRAASRSWGGAVDSRDGGTEELAIGMAKEIRRITGQSPYLVVAKFHRKYADANRPVEIAMEGPGAKPYYELYHRSIREFVDEIRRGHPAGVLLDVHGQDKMRDSLLRGTRNGRSILKLYRRAGAEGITGPHGLFGLLEAQGFKVFPANQDGVGAGREYAGLDGGYTVQRYGSDNADGIDAFLLEFGTVYRRADRVQRSAADAARAIAAFYEAYLK